MPSTQPMEYYEPLALIDNTMLENSLELEAAAMFGNQNPLCPPLGPSGLADQYELDSFMQQQGADFNGPWDTTTTYSKPSGPPFFTPVPDFPPHSLPEVPSNSIIPQTPQRTFSAESQDVLPTPGAFSEAQDEKKPIVKITADRSKTRAETQISLTIVLEPLSPRFKRVHFPKKTIAKPKYYANEQEKADFEKDGETLYMELFLVLATAVEKEEQRKLAFKRARGDLPVHRRPANVPLTDLDKADPSHPQNGGEVIICQGCKEREEKRYNRKKKKSVEDEREWEQYKNDRAIIINEKEYKNLKDITPEENADYQFSPLSKMVTLHMRIACYCRHQEEKSPLGYRVIFTFKDSHGKLVAQHMSEIFQITDDHKNKDFVADYSWNSASAPPLTSVSRPGPFPKPASRVPPPLVSPNNPASQIRYAFNLSKPSYTQPSMPTFSQPSTPIAPTFSTPISPIQTTFPQASATMSPLIHSLHDFNFATGSSANISSSGRAQMPRSQSLLDSATFIPHAGITANAQHQTPLDNIGYIPRVASLDTFQFHHQQQMQMRNWDYQSAPQSCSTTPITQSRPASPSWDQVMPNKKHCFYSQDSGFSMS